MASNIEFETIDEGFPVAGIDNNSQGFRDNFSIIKTSLADAKDEVTDLQENAARKDEDNDFANNSLIRVNLDTMTLSYLDGGAEGVITGPTLISIENGHYQKQVIAGDATLTLSDWPNENLASVIVELVGNDSGTHTVSFIGSDSANFKTTGKGFNLDSNPTTLKVDVNLSTEPKIIEFWSYDNGDTIYARFIGNYKEYTPFAPVMPSFTTTERDSVLVPVAGSVIFNTTTETFQGYNGSAWVDMSA